MSDRSAQSVDYAKVSARGIATGVFWLISSRLIGMVITLGTTAILARLLTPEDFGLMVVVMVAVNLAIAVVEGSISLPMLQLTKLSIEHTQVALALTTLVGVVGYLGFLVIGLVAGDLIGDPKAVHVVLVALLALPMQTCSVTLLAVLQRQSRFKKSASIAIVSGLLGYSVPTIVATLLGFGVWALVLGFISQSLVGLVMMARAAKVPPTLRPQWSKAKDFLSAGGAGTVMQVINWSALNSTNMIVGSWFGTGALGLFQRGGAVINLAKDILGASLSRTLLPAFASMSDNQAKRERAFERSMAVSLPLFSLISALLVVHAPAIVLLLLGKGWSETIPVLQLLAVGFMPRVAYKVTDTLSVSAGGHWGLAFRQTVYLALLFGCSIAGVPYGLPGVALGNAVGTTVYYVWSLWAALKFVPASRGRILLDHVRALVISIVVAGLDAAVIEGLSHQNFWVAQIAGGMVAGLASLLLLGLGPRFVLGEHVHDLRVSALRLVRGRIA